MADSRSPPFRSAPLRAVLALLVGAAIIVAGSAIWMARHMRREDTLSMPPLVAAIHPPGTPAAKAPQPGEAGSPRPSFDIVRVGPDGNAVLAGRATPGAEVVVHQGNKVIGRTRADADGDWVLLPTAPLAPGAQALTLTERTAGGKEQKGNRSVLLVVPERPAPVQQAGSGRPVQQAVRPVPPTLAVLAEGAQPPRVLQGPVPAPGTHKLQLGTVDYGDSGRVRFSGTAAPGSTVRVYVDKHPVGDARADAQGRWTLAPPEDFALGKHALRLDQLSGKGQVTARVELPFARARLAEQQLAPGSIVVQPGENLWLLARRSYGQGIRYLVIYQANHAQIRDPNLIYPGQVFNVPAAPETALPSRSSSSTSR